MNTKTSVALASTSALAAGVAQGGVIYSGLLNLQQNYDTVNYRQPVDMVGDGNDFTFGFEASSTKPYVDTRTAVSATISQSGIVSVLEYANTGLPVTPVGTMINSSYATTYPGGSRGYMYQDGNGNPAGDWSNTAITEGYVGVTLALSGGTSYGWLHFIDNPTATVPSLTLVDWAYQSTPGVGIQTGAVPEPSTLALAGLGLGALMMLRKRGKSA